MLERVVIGLVKGYQKFLSPLLPSVCRYQPSCSQYMIEAIQTYGVCKGVFLGIKRILRCHPWGGSGYDPVVPKTDDKTDKNLQ